MNRTYHIDGTIPKDDSIFVFGSNIQGIHGAGAAKMARERFGAKLRMADGLCGQSYAIPTRDMVAKNHFENLKLSIIDRLNTSRCFCTGTHVLLFQTLIDRLNTHRKA